MTNVELVADHISVIDSGIVGTLVLINPTLEDVEIGKVYQSISITDHEYHKYLMKYSARILAMSTYKYETGPVKKVTHITIHIIK
jgi:hypothetical protein